MNSRNSNANVTKKNAYFAKQFRALGNQKAGKTKTLILRFQGKNMLKK